MSFTDPSQSTPTLFHYTGSAGLLGIINEREIWATGSNYLNDPTEVTFAAEALADRLSRSLANQEHPIAREAVNLLERSYIDANSPNLYREDRSFISSFSRSDQSLTLWRLYAGQNGFCIGFNEQHLLQWVGRDWPNAEPVGAEEREEHDAIRANLQLSARIEDVTYGAAHVEPLLDDLYSIPPNLGSTFEIEHRIREVFDRLTRIKHPAYEDEREARLILRAFGDFADDPGVRISATGALVAYRRLVFPFEAVQSITMAPGANAAQQKQALGALMARGGRGPYGHVDVRESPLPFVW